MKRRVGQLVLLIVAMAAITAGCTSPTATPGTNLPAPQGPATYAGDQVIGTWNWMSTGGSSGLQVYYAFAEDGTFTRTDKRDSAKTLYSGTWSKPDGTTYALVYRGTNPGFDSENLYYSNQTGYLRNDSNDFFRKA